MTWQDHVTLMCTQPAEWSCCGIWHQPCPSWAAALPGLCEAVLAEHQEGKNRIGSHCLIFCNGLKFYAWFQILKIIHIEANLFIRCWNTPLGCFSLITQNDTASSARKNFSFFFQTRTSYTFQNTPELGQFSPFRDLSFSISSSSSDKIQRVWQTGPILHSPSSSAREYGGKQQACSRSIPHL